MGGPGRAYSCRHRWSIPRGGHGIPVDTLERRCVPGRITGLNVSLGRIARKLDTVFVRIRTLQLADRRTQCATSFSVDRRLAYSLLFIQRNRYRLHAASFEVNIGLIINIVRKVLSIEINI